MSIWELVAVLAQASSQFRPALEAARPPKEPKPEAKLLLRAEVVPGELFVPVYAHAIETRDGMLPCWTYVTDGLARHGQREIVFTLRKPPGEDEEDFPKEIFYILKAIFGFAQEGRLAPAGGFTVWQPGTRILGRAGRWGFLYLPAETFTGIPTPPNALAAILIKDDETDLIQKGFFYRIATNLGKAYRYFPFPPWSDPDRQPVITMADMEKSILSHVRLLRVPGITIRAPYETGGPSTLPEALPGDLIANFRIKLRLRVSREALPKLQSCLSSISNGPTVALMTDPDPFTLSRLGWVAETGRTGAIIRSPNHGDWVTGGFLILAIGKGLAERGAVHEDGFGVVLGPESWDKLAEAIGQGLDVEIPLGDGGDYLAVEIPPALSAYRAFQGTYTMLYPSDDLLRERTPDLNALLDYCVRLEEAVTPALAGYARPSAHGLLLAVGLKPGGMVRVWCEAVEGEVPDVILARIRAELERIPAPRVRNGPIAFSRIGVLWERTVKSWPRIPAEWQKAANSANKTLGIPDELFAVIWPDEPAVKR